MSNLSARRHRLHLTQVAGNHLSHVICLDEIHIVGSDAHERGQLLHRVMCISGREQNESWQALQAFALQGKKRVENATRSGGKCKSVSIA
jgi:hypothetical protein